MPFEKISIPLILIFLFLLACRQEISIPKYFPQDNLVQFDTLSKAQIELGRKLFFDKRLSIDSTISCGSCHKPTLAFTDGEIRSKGLPNHFSRHNSSTLLNIAFSPSFMFDKRAISLETQSMIPLSDTNEMGMGIEQVVHRLENDNEYKTLSSNAYQSTFNGYVITRALAAFIKSLISANSKYDDFLKKDSSIFTKEEWAGYKLFVNKANCNSCHTTPLFTNHKHYDLGLEFGKNADIGLLGGTLDVSQIYRFKTPTLRNIAITAPYFHNGKTKTLREVIDYHSNPIHKTKDLNPVQLTNSEKTQLLAFLMTLTDKEFIK